MQHRPTAATKKLNFIVPDLTAPNNALLNPIDYKFCVSLCLLYGYGFFLPAFILIFSVLAKKLAEKSVSDVTYLVSSCTLNVNQSVLIPCSYVTMNQKLKVWTHWNKWHKRQISYCIFPKKRLKIKYLLMLAGASLTSTNMLCYVIKSDMFDNHLIISIFTNDAR